MIRPLRDFMIVRPFKRSISDILETPAAVGIDRGRPNMDGRAIVLAVGPGRRNRRQGWYNPLEVRVGDLIAFEDHKAYPKDPTDAELLIMQGADCVVLENFERITIPKGNAPLDGTKLFDGIETLTVNMWKPEYAA